MTIDQQIKRIWKEIKYVYWILALGSTFWYLLDKLGPKKMAVLMDGLVNNEH